MSILEVHGLSKEYPTFSLSRLSFSLAPGKITGFIGRNGAGKSTTLRCLLGFVAPDHGEISFFGLPWQGHEKEIKAQIGYIPGGFDFYPNKRLKRITAVAKSFYPNWDDAAYRRCISLFSLDENKTPSKLSAGMRVKYALALALSHGAQLLILDEPTSGLDPISRDELMDIFLELKAGGTTILFSTHITSELDQCADRILYIREGQLIADEELDAFVSGYGLWETEEAAARKTEAGALIGGRVRNGVCRALMTRENAARLGASLAPVNTETVMVYLEREERL